MEPLLASHDLDLQYHGYYYAYRDAIRRNHPEEAEEQLANMERIQDKVNKMVLSNWKLV